MCVYGHNANEFDTWAQSQSKNTLTPRAQAAHVAIIIVCNRNNNAKDDDIDNDDIGNDVGFVVVVAYGYCYAFGANDAEICASVNFDNNTKTRQNAYPWHAEDLILLQSPLSISTDHFYDRNINSSILLSLFLIEDWFSTNHSYNSYFIYYLHYLYLV